MKTFYAFDSRYCEARRVAAVNDGFYEMTEGDGIIKIDKIDNYIFLGEDGDLLLPKTIMDLFKYFPTDVFWNFERYVDKMVARMRRWELRCDPDHDTCDIHILMDETGKDTWNLEINDIGDVDGFLTAENISEEEGKRLARKVIEAAIALGVDIRAHWEFHHLDEKNENQKTDSHESEK